MFPEMTKKTSFPVFGNLSETNYGVSFEYDQKLNTKGRKQDRIALPRAKPSPEGCDKSGSTQPRRCDLSPACGAT